MVNFTRERTPYGHETNDPVLGREKHDEIVQLSDHVGWFIFEENLRTQFEQIPAFSRVPSRG